MKKSAVVTCFERHRSSTSHESLGRRFELQGIDLELRRGSVLVLKMIVSTEVIHAVVPHSSALWHLCSGIDFVPPLTPQAAEILRPPV